MGKKRNLIEGCTQEDLDFINEYKTERMNLQLNGSEYKNSSKALSYRLDLKCKNQKQKEYLKLLKEKDIVFLNGPAGSGKSYTTLQFFLHQLKHGLYKKIVLIIPTTQTDMEIGFTKGSTEEKLFVHAEQLFYTIEKILDKNDNSGKAILANLLKEGFIEVRCVSFLRGINLDNCLTVVSECQQFPKSAFKTIMTRIGEGGSKIVFEGDLEQIDNKEIKRNKQECGFIHAMKSLKNIDEVGVVEFGREDIVRNPLISKLLDAWDQNEY